ncbi:MAG TPA: hypothetical protein VH498_09220 [Candidatus Dormibacteraeota bacterium]|jgi:hypothetical protein|nr:hypothetical protein [Candidatus Dormibacteraeota bacterium]
MPGRANEPSIDSGDDDAPPTPVVTRCGELGCNGQPLEVCAYVDSRGRACRTHWCPEHGARIGGSTYCRRHAGTIGALGSKANNPRALPDVGHRGASLVRWLYRDLDPTLTNLLESLSTERDHLLRDNEVAVVRSESGARQWEMGWKLASPAGVRLRIALIVEEADDSIVLVSLDNNVVASGVPPWIESRRRGQARSGEEDAQQRREFYAFIVNFLAEALRARS